jgi:hypothetical protein
MKKTQSDFSHIKGWGVDADPLDVPAYPMKKRTENDNKGMIWERPPQQPALTEILHSNERPGLSAVFGTPNPPTGLSGKIRRFAFKYSESSFAHWLPLLLADRINMFEGIAEDFQKGHVPDLVSEFGMRSELKYNPQGFAKKVVTCLAIGALVVLIAKRKK